MAAQYAESTPVLTWHVVCASAWQALIDEQDILQSLQSGSSDSVLDSGWKVNERLTREFCPSNAAFIWRIAALLIFVVLSGLLFMRFFANRESSGSKRVCWFERLSNWMSPLLQEKRYILSTGRITIKWRGFLNLKTNYLKERGIRKALETEEDCPGRWFLSAFVATTN